MPVERVSRSFKDLSMSFKANPLNDDLIALKNENAISRSIRNIVFTVPGEKFFQEDFGSDVRQSLFENIDDISASNIKDQIQRSIINLDPEHISAYTLTSERGTELFKLIKWLVNLLARMIRL